MSSSSSVPLRIPRLAALSLTWALAVIASGTGLNALIKSGRDQDALKSKVPAPTVVTIDISDVRTTGIIATTICLLTAVLTFLYIVVLLVPIRYRSTSTPLSTRTLRLQWMSLAFCAVFLFAVQIPFTHYFATRSVNVHAFIGTLELPKSAIETVEKQLGVTSVYKDIPYLRLTAIFPWLTFASILATIGVTIVAISRARHPEHAPAQANGSASSIVEKGRVSDADVKGKAEEQEMQERV